MSFTTPTAGITFAISSPVAMCRATASGWAYIYVHDRFNVEPQDLAFTCTKWEGYCIKISQTEPFIKHHIIANIYKSPYEGSEDFDVFLKEFYDLFNLLQNFGHSSHICGDFNINLLKIHSKPPYNTFFENMLSGFYPKITLPTRICDTSSTIIDLTFTLMKLIVMTIQEFLSITYQIIKPFLLPHRPNLVLKCKINVSPFKQMTMLH